MKDRNLFHLVNTIGNIFTSGCTTRENITDGVHLIINFDLSPEKKKKKKKKRYPLHISAAKYEITITIVLENFDDNLNFPSNFIQIVWWHISAARLSRKFSKIITLYFVPRCINIPLWWHISAARYEVAIVIILENSKFPGNFIYKV